MSVRRATDADVADVIHILAVGFMADPVSCWLFPDEADRALRHEAFFRIFADYAFAYGTVYRTDSAAALWLTIDPGAPDPPVPDGDLAAAVGPHLPRLGVLGALMSAEHPHDIAHAYLPFIAVLPEARNAGQGSALLAHHLGTLSTPAYLEASSARSIPLYERHGFVRQAPIQLPDGPVMQPMWRPAG